MDNHQIEKIYFTLTGVICGEFRVPDIENLFAEGSYCANLYADMLNAYEKLCERLGVIDEDEDVETIIFSLMCIERRVSAKMFQYGMTFGAMEHN